MRVVVASDVIAGLSSVRAGTSIARAFSQAGAHCAVVPMADAGPQFVTAWADLRALSPATVPACDGVTASFAYDQRRGDVAIFVQPRPADPWGGDSADFAHGIRGALNVIDGQVASVVIDVSAHETHDGGRGFVDAIGNDLDGVTLTGVVGIDEVDQPLTGLRGIVSRDGRPDGLDVADLLRYDGQLVDWAHELSARRGDGMNIVERPGAGACGGMGAAILGLGGSIQAASDFLAQRARLLETMAQADLVVTGCEQLDFGAMGGGAVRHVVDLASQAMRPAIVLTSKNFISQRELRSVGIEQACEVGTPDLDAPEAWLENSARRIASGWVWS